jgi:uncharacterized protein (TIGR02117 family)
MRITRLSLPLILTIFFACVTCAAPVKDLFPPAETEHTKTIYLVSHGWHAGIVVKRTDIPDGVWQEQNNFPESEYLETGWGDRTYYMTPEAHWGTAFKAALWPTQSVLHIVRFSDTVPAYFPNSEIIRIKLSFQGFERLIRYIADSYAKDEAGHAILLGPGLYGNSHFYLSREIYHGFKTCNVWTARALRAAGCPITPAFAIRVEGLMSRARTFGVVVQPGPSVP